MRLSQLPVGSGAVIRSVDPGRAGEGRRLQEVGFVPGTVVRAERRAPLGDPTVYEIRSTRLALRREGADLVQVDPIVDADHADDADDATEIRVDPVAGEVRR